jgi:phospholipase/carboxylesterase
MGARVSGVWFAWFAALAIAACDARPVAQSEAADRHDADFQPPDAAGFGRAAGLVYFEEIVGAAQSTDALPLIVFLHGRGDRPRPHFLPLAPPRAVRVIMPRAPLPFGDGYSWFDYRAATANTPQAARAIGDAASRVAAAIEVLRAKRPTLGLPIVGGFSQGGMLSYALAVKQPSLIALALPLSGLLPEAMWPAAALPSGAHAPKIRAAHGTDDTLVPFAQARATVDALGAHGYDVAFLEEPGLAHAVSERMVAMLNREIAAELERTPRQ